jgi:hypothetical protein
MAVLAYREVIHTRIHTIGHALALLAQPADEGFDRPSSDDRIGITV